MPAIKPKKSAVSKEAKTSVDKTPASSPKSKAAPVTASKTKAKALPEDQKTVIEAAAPAEKKKTAKASKSADAAGPAKVAAKRGPKAKSAKAGKKAEDHDIDMSDIEEDLVGEPEVAEATTEKVKPLRMKISKAKERALMKEFGLDETVLSEEDLAKRRLRLKALIKLGKTRGYLTTAKFLTTCPTSWLMPRHSKS